MDEFPFSEADWSKVKQAALPIVNAGLANDVALRESLLPRLLTVLADLRHRYGVHPVLLETVADFIDGSMERIELYQHAKQIAQENELPILSICLSLARVLLDDLREPERAHRELIACQKELALYADESVVQEWSKLMEECNGLMNRTLPVQEC